MAVASSSTKKPLIVLAGWLGCRPRKLRRYEDLYRNAGFNVISRIATPNMVFRCAFPLAPVHVPPPPSWPDDDDEVPSPPMSMQDLAWEVLKDIHQSECPVFFFHAFSNGGCFLYEQIGRILGAYTTTLTTTNMESSQDDERDGGIVSTAVQQREVLTRLRKQMRGVIFDSCPGVELYRVDEALNHCSWDERLQVALQNAFRYIFLHRPFIHKEILSRQKSYIHFLETDPLDIPQLYLYSRDDSLAPFEQLNDIIRHRQQLFGSDHILKRTWESSPHCGHLLQHPQDYKAAVESFVKRCLDDNNGRPVQSRL